MPVDEGGAGYSAETARKQEHLRHFLDVHLHVVQNIHARHVPRLFPQPAGIYVYIDLTAGPGRINGLPGSPVIFTQTADEIGMERLMICYERNRRAAQRLRGELRFAVERTDSSCCRIIAADHRLAIGEAMTAVAEMEQPVWGLVYADTNGVLPAETLRLLSLQPAFARIDFLCYVSGGYHKRIRALLPHRGSLREELGRIRKAHIHVRQPHTAWQWGFVFLTNWPGYRELKEIGFHAAGSPRGAALLDRLDRTKRQRERDGQQELEL